MDLQFPHHENEIAQSEGASGRPFVNVWMHNGFLNVDNEKMSKSLGNFFTIRDVLKRYDGETLRFFMLRTHYRSPFNFSDAQPRRRAQRAAPAVHRARRRGRAPTRRVDWAQPQAAAFRAAMNDDFNTPLARGGAVRTGRRAEPHARRRRPPALLQGPGRRAGRAAAERRAPTCRAARALDEARIQAADRRPRRGQEGARLRRGRPHPRRTGAQGVVLKDCGRRHHLGQGLTMPRTGVPQERCRRRHARLLGRGLQAPGAARPRA